MSFQHFLEKVFSSKSYQYDYMQKVQNVKSKEIITLSLCSKESLIHLIDDYKSKGYKQISEIKRVQSDDYWSLALYTVKMFKKN